MKQIFNFDTHSNYTSTNIPNYVDTVSFCKDQIDIHYEKSAYEGNDDIVPIEYIQSSGTQYIDTNIELTSLLPQKYININIEVLVNDNTWQSVFGSRWTANDVDTCLIQTSTQGNWYTRINGTGYYLNKQVVGNHNCRVENNMCYLDNTAFTNAGTIPRYSAATLTILATHNKKDNTIQDTGLKCKIFNCKIGNGNILVRDLIPVRVGTVGYMYDNVSGQLFANTGSGNFILGPDL